MDHRLWLQFWHEVQRYTDLLCYKNKVHMGQYLWALELKPERSYTSLYDEIFTRGPRCR